MEVSLQDEQEFLELRERERLDREREEYEQWERWLHSVAFGRVDERKTKWKRQCKPGCGHWIDAGEPYRYQVWKLNGDTVITQRLDCEFCARGDLREGK